MEMGESSRSSAATRSLPLPILSPSAGGGRCGGREEREARREPVMAAGRDARWRPKERRRRPWRKPHVQIQYDDDDWGGSYFDPCRLCQLKKERRWRPRRKLPRSAAWNPVAAVGSPSPRISLADGDPEERRERQHSQGGERTGAGVERDSPLPTVVLGSLGYSMGRGMGEIG
uniref:Uncharacterized protein n=1 Tax=Oryza barthii TaxID=65489 RepID=A0A0D3F5I1_9ORYZ